MRVCFLSSMHPPLDKRVFVKEAVSLAVNGFDVVHVAPDDRLRTWVQDGVVLVTYPRRRGIVGRLMQLTRIYRVAARQRADCYHCNELDSWVIGVLLRLTRRAMVVFDVHEHYPSQFAERGFPDWLRPAAASFMRLVFRVLTPLTDRLVFAKKFITTDFGGSERKHVVVENFAPLVLDDNERATAPRGSASSAVTAIHIGSMTQTRCWPELLRALDRVRALDLRLHLVGTFADGSEPEFQALVEQLGLADRVVVEPWLPIAEAYRRVFDADIGLVLLRPGIHNHVLALPHKMFDYMLAGLPVIAPKFAVEVAEIVQDANCGLLTDTSSVEEIARALERLALDPQERRRLGDHGRRAVYERYNWEREAVKLVAMYRDLSRENLR